MKVQIYSIKTPEDAVLCAEEGIDFIGVATGETGLLPNELNFAACRAVFAAIPPGANLWKNAMTIATDPAEIIATVRATAPDLVHICGEIEDYRPAVIAAVRQAVSPVKVLMAIPVRTPDDIRLAESYAPVSDYFILDTKVSGFVGVGATGQTHDWNVSAELVRRVHVPVILAGGLSPDNVAEAIRVVKPWAVDSFTHTNAPGTKRKDRARVRAFAAAARAVHNP